MNGPMLARSRFWRPDPYDEAQWYAPRHGTRRRKRFSDLRVTRRRESRALRREQTEE